MPHNFLAEWLMLITVFGIAVLSPGPDFVMTVKNALTHGRRAGLFTAIGLGFGVLVHVSYTLLGLAAVIAKSVLFFNILKYCGAAYLVYMGIKALRSKGMTEDPMAQTKNVKAEKHMDNFAALRSGFITNILNPKACLFFLALFTQIIKPDTPHMVQAVYGITCGIMVTVWFATVTFILTTSTIRRKFLSATKWIDRVCGTMFIALGLKLALTKAPH